MGSLKGTILELIKSTSTKLPNDVVDLINNCTYNEKNGTPAKYAMDIILENIKLAEEKEQPICQDTGSILFFVKAPKGFDQADFTNKAKEAVVEATDRGLLRQNSVCPLTGKNSGNNLGPGSPYFCFEQISNSPSPQLTPQGGEEIEIRLILKGGGCENVGTQYSLPNIRLGAQRNIDGVKKCVIDAVHQAQGKGCAPGFLGVTIGGDHTTGYLHSKEQFLRKLSDTNKNPDLAAMEVEITEKANRLGIGPMGFGGNSTLLGCKIGFLNRLPANYFVTISYMCWAFRRQGVTLDNTGKIKKWLY